MSLPESSATQSPTSAGKFAVLAMLLVGVLAATFAWWWNFNRGRESLHFFGSQAAKLIRTAPTVEILVPLADVAEGESTNDVMQRYGVHGVRRIDVSQARGLIHARTSLLNDASYKSDLHPPLHATAYFICFRDPASEILLGFTEPDGSIQIASSGDYRQLAKKTADGWRSFIKRNVEAAAAKATPPGPARTGPSE